MLPVGSRPRQQSHLLPGARSLTPWLNEERFRSSLTSLGASCLSRSSMTTLVAVRPRLYAKTKEVPVIVTKFGQISPSRYSKSV
jgi:hypothetical protein